MGEPTIYFYCNPYHLSPYRLSPPPMPLVSTDAIILHSFRYGETSKIVRLLTRDHGPQSVIAKGAMNPKSKFGARLQSRPGEVT